MGARCLAMGVLCSPPVRYSSNVGSMWSGRVQKLGCCLPKEKNCPQITTPLLKWKKKKVPCDVNVIVVKSFSDLNPCQSWWAKPNDVDLSLLSQMRDPQTPSVYKKMSSGSWVTSMTDGHYYSIFENQPCIYYLSAVAQLMSWHWWCY